MAGRAIAATLPLLNRLLGTSFTTAPGSTGSGALVRATSPTLTTPTLGVAAATSVTFAPVAWASKPAPGTPGREIFVSDVGVTGSKWIDHNGRWKPVGNRVLLASLDAPSGSIGSATTAVLQQGAPAGLLQLGDRLEVRLTQSRSGSVDIARWSFNVGSAVTTADTAVMSDAALISNTNLNTGFLSDFRVIAATSMEPLGSTTLGYGNTSANATLTPVTISNISGALGFTIGVRSSGATNTVIARDAQIWLVAPAN